MIRRFALPMFILWLTAAVPAQAAYLSEIYLEQLPGGGSTAIELGGLRGTARVDLVMVQASQYQQPLVRQIIPFEPTRDVHLISDEAWPNNLWVDRTTDSAAFVSLGSLLGDGSSFDLGATPLRHVLLYVGVSGLTVGQVLPAASPWADAVTIGDPAYARRLRDEPLLMPADAAGLIRLNGSTVRHVAGRIADNGTLQSGGLTYEVSPGQINPSQPIPEPGTLALLAGLLLVRLPRANRLQSAP